MPEIGEKGREKERKRVKNSRFFVITNIQILCFRNHFGKKKIAFRKIVKTNLVIKYKNKKDEKKKILKFLYENETS